MHPNEGLFSNEEVFVRKNDIGGNNFWPIQYFDMVYTTILWQNNDNYFYRD